MLRVIELFTGFATAPSSTFTAVTNATNNTNTVRTYDESKGHAHLLSAWGYFNAAGCMRIRSNKMNDAQQGLRLRVNATNVQPLLPIGYGNDQILYSNDALTVDVIGSAVGGQIETVCLLIGYEVMGTIAGNFIGVDALRARADRNELGVEVPITSGSAGGYSGQVAINSTFDNLEANVEYAIVGMTMDVNAAAIQIVAPDWGNFGVGIPGDAVNKAVTADWFARLSQATGQNCIPVFNGSNKANVLLQVAQNQAGAAVKPTLILQRLSKVA